MPRDISGVYTLPAPMPVQPRTIPVTNIFNTVLADVRDALNNIPGDALAPGSVGTTQLEDNSVTNAKMADNAINTAELVDGSVTNAKMANNSVDTAELVDGAVTTPKLANEAVTNAKIQAQPTFTGPAAGILGTVGAALELRKTAGRIGAIGNTSGVDDRLYVVADEGAIQLVPNNLGLGTEEFVLLQKGQLKFPVTQNPSTDPNTLDDYEEGTWTPVVDAGTQGNLSVTYHSQGGQYIKVGRLVYIYLGLNFTPTYTTASGELIISGLPFPATNESALAVSYFSGKAGGSAPMARRRASDTSALRIANLLNNATYAISDIPSGTTSVIIISGCYHTL